MDRQQLTRHLVERRWEDLRPIEKAHLLQKEPALLDAVRSGCLKAVRTIELRLDARRFEELSWLELSQLFRRDEDTFRRLAMDAGARRAGVITLADGTSDRTPDSDPSTRKPTADDRSAKHEAPSDNARGVAQRLSAQRTVSLTNPNVALQPRTPDGRWTEIGAGWKQHSTQAKYELKPAERPAMVFDHGHLDDRTPSHGIDESRRRDPTPEDYKAYYAWMTRLQELEALMPSMRDGTRAYRHFLTGGGTPLKIDYGKYLRDDASGQVTLRSAIDEASRAAENIFARSGGTLSEFEFTGSPIRCGESNPRYPYPNSLNWQFAIGGHLIWISGRVQVVPPTPPDEQPLFRLKMTIHAEDQYNFDPGKIANVVFVPDSSNGRFEECGLANEFRSTGEYEHTFEWRRGKLHDQPFTSPSDLLLRSGKDGRSSLLPKSTPPLTK